MIFPEKEKKVNDLAAKLKSAIMKIRQKLTLDGLPLDEKGRLENRLDRLTSLARTETEACRRAK